MKRFMVYIHCNWGYSRPSVLSYDDKADAFHVFDNTELGGLGNVIAVSIYDNQTGETIARKHLSQTKIDW